MGWTRWKEICGGNADEGTSMFNLLFGLRMEKGTVPKGMKINYEKAEKK